MSLFLKSTPPSNWISDATSRDQMLQIISFLTEQQTFRFPTLANGLFSAIGSEDADAEVTGYRNVWLRDNIHIAWAHLDVLEDPETPLKCVRSLLQFYRKHRHRFSNIIEGREDFDEPMNRPHIRFNGTDLTELDEKWSHAQNDALGYLLWLSCKLIQQEHWLPEIDEWNILADLVHFFATVRYWQDEDSGHWEEVRKIAASSIGAVLAGMTLLRDLQQLPEVADALARTDRPVSPELLDALIHKGRTELQTILPAECIQTDPAQHRQYDAALLFLIYPLGIVDQTIANKILERVASQLQGPIGIRRYPGDSYWCADYKQLLGAEQRTADFSDNLEARDSLLKPGFEAQWCIFDPIISCIYGHRFQESGATSDRDQQILYLQRSLAQLTSVDSRFGGWRCPESYFCERGSWVPNDITPLLWTQANLWQALHLFARTTE